MNFLDLDELVRIRQSLISQGTLTERLNDLRTVDPLTEIDPRFTFLETVQRYSDATKSGTADSVQWVSLLSDFSAIEATTPELEFYLPNYMLLCARNAGPPIDVKVPELFRTAADAALKLPEEEQDEALGHLQYNVARWMLKKDRRDDALTHWQAASRHRFQFYGLLKAAGNEPYERLLAAAQQVAKMRIDFPAFFKDKDVDECGVEAKILDELKADFPKDLDKFSAKP